MQAKGKFVIWNNALQFVRPQLTVSLKLKSMYLNRSKNVIGLSAIYTTVPTITRFQKGAARRFYNLTLKQMLLFSQINKIKTFHFENNKCSFSGSLIQDKPGNVRVLLSDLQNDKFVNEQAFEFTKDEHFLLAEIIRQSVGRISGWQMQAQGNYQIKEQKDKVIDILQTFQNFKQ